jgi:hypothetical protein
MRSAAFMMAIFKHPNFKHPKTGGFYLRRIVPEALRE